MINTLDDLEKLFELMDRHRIDSVEVEGVKVVKTQWSSTLVAATEQASVAHDEDDLLYYASDD